MRAVTVLEEGGDRRLGIRRFAPWHPPGTK